MKPTLQNFFSLLILIIFLPMAHAGVITGNGGGKPVEPVLDKVAGDLNHQTLTITGSNLSNATARLGNNNLNVTSTTATTLVADLPSGTSAGSYHVVVTSFSGGTANRDVTLGTEDADRGNGNTAEGNRALFSLTTGTDNTALGDQALSNDTIGLYNCATGSQALFTNTAGTFNTATGYQALYGNTTGNFNTATGFLALSSNTTGQKNTASGAQALTGNTTGSFNTCDGYNALYSNTSGHHNTATGFEALLTNLTGINNTADGVGTLRNNVTGQQDTAIGVEALRNNTDGSNNTAAGFQALYTNTTGHDNTAIGLDALFNNGVGQENTATGVNALHSNNNGSFNTANGKDTLLQNQSGGSNTANGNSALSSNISGSNNVALGVNSLMSNSSGSDNTALGVGALSGNITGGNNTALGENAGVNLTTGNNNIDIGNPGVAAESNTVRIGTTGTHAKVFIAGVRDTTTGSANSVNVLIDPNGQLGTLASSERFKNAIRPMDHASEAILSLKPVTFHYKTDGTNTPQFGLIAEEVAKVNPALVVRDANGEIYSVRYEAVNAMLLNEFLKEHRKVEALEARIKELDFKIQKVSNKVELSRPGARTVDNKP